MADDLRGFLRVKKSVKHDLLARKRPPWAKLAEWSALIIQAWIHGGHFSRQTTAASSKRLGAKCCSVRSSHRRRRLDEWGVESPRGSEVGWQFGNCPLLLQLVLLIIASQPQVVYGRCLGLVRRCKSGWYWAAGPVVLFEDHWLLKPTPFPASVSVELPSVITDSRCWPFRVLQLVWVVRACMLDLGVGHHRNNSVPIKALHPFWHHVQITLPLGLELALNSDMLDIWLSMGLTQSEP